MEDISQGYLQALSKAARFGTLLILGGLVACSSQTKGGLRPLPPEDLMAPFVSVVGQPVTFESINSALDNTISKVGLAARGKAGQEWNLGDATVLGGVAATAGFLASRTGLANTGLGVAGAGLAGSTHYKPEAQVDVYLRANDKLACIKNELSGLTDALWEQAMSAQKLTPEQRMGLMRAKQDSVTAIQAVLNTLSRELLSMRSEPLTRAQLEDMLNELKGAKEAKASASSRFSENTGDNNILSLEPEEVAAQRKEAEAQAAYLLFSDLRVHLKLCGEAVAR